MLVNNTFLTIKTKTIKISKFKNEVKIYFYFKFL